MLSKRIVLPWLLALLLGSALRPFAAVGRTPGTLLLAQEAQAVVEPQLAIVWPHDGRGNPTPVIDSHAVNISLWPRNSGYCTYPLNFRLMRATENGITMDVEVEPQPFARTVGGVAFNSLEFNDVPAPVARERRQYRFVAYGEGLPTRGAFHGNVWVHAADARTLLPNPAVPGSFYHSPTADAYDARIQIVWPHDGRGNAMSVDRATHVNVAVEVFVHGTSNVPIPDESGSYLFTVRLLAAEGNGPLLEVQREPQIVTYRLFDGPEWPRWVFNDLAVHPNGQTTFVVSLLPAGAKSTSPYSTIWTHAADPRTVLPQPAPPPPCT